METEKDTLSQVIEVEKEIQKCLALEKVKAAEWLEGVKKETEAESLGEETRIREALEESRTAASKEADRKAAEIVSTAALEAERLGHLETKTLQGIIEKQIARILPG